MELKKGNVCTYAKGEKYVIRADRKAKDGEMFVCKKPHEDGDFSYMCSNKWCRCSS